MSCNLLGDSLRIFLLYFVYLVYACTDAHSISDNNSFKKMKPTGVPVQDEMFPEGVDAGLMDMDEVWWWCHY